jgi:transcriptional regulator GlxA family with amidase domain
MQAEYSEGRPGAATVVRGYLAVVLMEIWRAGKYQRQSTVDEATWQWVGKAMRIIQENAGRINITTLAQQMGWSVDHFSRSFRRVTGQTPSEFALRQRVRRASALLLATDLPIEVIARQVGYASARSLRHAFVACLGVTPQEYRELATSNQGSEIITGSNPLGCPTWEE